MKNSYAENYNSPLLVGIWGDFIDWRRRRLGENGFLEKTLAGHGCKRVLDASLGDGCDSIHLIKQGFEVTSNEIDSLFIERALLNAKKANVNLSVTCFDWRELDEKFERDSFDAVLLLGNSLTYLFRRNDRLRALKAFKNVLRKGGVLLIDERNYEYMLKNRAQILAGKFKYSGKFVYCGSKVHGRPVEIRDNKVVMKYEHENGKTAFLTLYPFKKGELKGLLKEASFGKIMQYSDYHPGYSSNADFHQYVTVK